MTPARVGNPLDDTTRTAVPPAGPSQDDAENQAYLIVLAGSAIGEMYKLEHERTVMGRGEKATIRLMDEGISREHSQILREGDQMILADMGSTNGTFCNGIRVDRHPLADGDKILLGSTTILKFTYHDKLDEMFQRQMSESALRDGLTKAFNKRYFGERLETEYTYTARHRTPLSLIFMDIDHFKKINDVHGHQGGDYILAELATVVSNTLRPEDIFSRYGGEEFAIIARGTEIKEAQEIAERLRAAVEAHEFVYDGAKIAVTVSIGVARAPDPAVHSPAELVAMADETMYKAKRSGRNRVCVRGDEPAGG